MSSILGMPPSHPPLSTATAEGSGSGTLPPLALGALSSSSGGSGSSGRGSGRVLASAVRHEGERTTYLLSPPPGQRAECTPEHPSWHFASSARASTLPVPGAAASAGGGAPPLLAAAECEGSGAGEAGSPSTQLMRLSRACLLLLSRSARVPAGAAALARGGEGGAGASRPLPAKKSCRRAS